MILERKTESGTIFYIGNEAIGCLLQTVYGKLQLLHVGIPLFHEDAKALDASRLLGWGNDVLYEDGDPASCLDTIPLAWSENRIGDYRESSIELLSGGQAVSGDFVFYSSEILKEEEGEEDSCMPHARGTHETLNLVF